MITSLHIVAKFLMSVIRKELGIRRKGFLGRSWFIALYENLPKAEKHVWYNTYSYFNNNFLADFFYQNPTTYVCVNNFSSLNTQFKLVSPAFCNKKFILRV